MYLIEDAPSIKMMVAKRATKCTPQLLQQLHQYSLHYLKCKLICFNSLLWMRVCAGKLDMLIASHASSGTGCNSNFHLHFKQKSLQQLHSSAVQGGEGGSYWRHNTKIEWKGHILACSGPSCLAIQRTIWNWLVAGSSRTLFTMCACGGQLPAKAKHSVAVFSKKMMKSGLFCWSREKGRAWGPHLVSPAVLWPTWVSFLSVFHMGWLINTTRDCLSQCICTVCRRMGPWFWGL